MGLEPPTGQVFTHPTPQYPPRVMAAVFNQPTWRAITPINLDALLHDLLKHLERVLPKFDLGKGILVEDHLKSFYISLALLNVEHEDVVCRLFPYTFEPKACSWYFSLKANSIAN